ncbi:MAG: GNAT family N-acetyltransferase [Candidatus Heimdallarchaeota archaeon]|nr:GNAT family N-acetyltransferase [Candidatus Heimdallarchaeota archaeon]MDH5645591.1 GNAT family N-acetyltransferase [Candidatus Heimdallarchaeota archaeon]
MVSIQKSTYSLEMISGKKDQIKEFVLASFKWVKEIERRDVEQEINRIKGNYHIDHCWILRNSEKIGVVRIVRGLFYALGLDDAVSPVEIPKILDEICLDTSSWNFNKLEATIHQDFLHFLIEKEFMIDYSRKKLLIKFADFSPVPIDETIIVDYSKIHFHQVVNTFIDAYRGSIDEKIGMFGPNIARSAIESIINGNFGKFIPELSGVILEKDTNYVQGAVMCTISENIPFVVIIGLRSLYKNQGLGRKLLTWCILRSIQKGYEEMSLWVTTENNNALHLYKSLGFTEVLTIFKMQKNF